MTFHFNSIAIEKAWLTQCFNFNHLGIKENVLMEWDVILSLKEELICNIIKKTVLLLGL